MDGLHVTIHLCADTISGMANFVTGIQAAFVKGPNDQEQNEPLSSEPTFERKPSVSSTISASQSLSSSTNLLGMFFLQPHRLLY